MAAADTAKLVASLTLDDRGFKTGLASANKGIGSLEKTISKVGSRASAGINQIGTNLAKIGTIGAVGAVGLLAKSVQIAGSLNEQLNKTSAVFGEASDSVKAFSKTTADSLGISQVEALEAAGNFGNMFKTVGLADKQSAEFSTTLVTLAADMASFNDEDPSEMLDKLRSGLAGEAEPLRQFGVLLSEAEVKAEAYATGIAKTGEKLTEAQKVQARYSLILKQTAVQQGDFTRTNESFANVMRRVKANLTDAGAVIGTALLPKITELSLKLNKLIVDNGPAIQRFADQLPAAFDKALAFAEKIPWETIGRGMEQAAFFTGKLIDAFLAMPPEMQTLLIGLAGLNKLSGGAVTGIVSELGKGLIKGVLGINAGVVNVNAAKMVGGPGGGLGPAGTALGGIGAVAGGVALAGAAGITVLQFGAAELTKSIIAGITGSEKAGNVAQQVSISTSSFAGPIDRLMRALQGDFRSGWEVERDLAGGAEATAQQIKSALGQQVAKTQQVAALQNVTNERQESIRMQQAAANAKAITDSVSERNATAQAGAKAAAASAAAGRATQAAVERARAAIVAKDLSVRVATYTTLNNKFNISQSILTQQTFKKFYTVNS